MEQLYSEVIHLDYARKYPATINLEEIEGFYYFLRQEAFIQSRFHKNKEVQEWLHDNGVSSINMNVDCTNPYISSVDNGIVLHYLGNVTFKLSINFPDDKIATMFKLKFQGVI